MTEPGYGEGRKWWRQGYEAGREEVRVERAAEVWDEGYLAGMNDERGPSSRRATKNPYRSEK